MTASIPAKGHVPLALFAFFFVEEGPMKRVLLCLGLLAVLVVPFAGCSSSPKSAEGGCKCGAGCGCGHCKSGGQSACGCPAKH